MGDFPQELPQENDSIIKRLRGLIPDTEISPSSPNDIYAQQVQPLLPSSQTNDYLNQLKQMPKREDYHPSLLRKAASTLLVPRYGIEAQQEFEDRPYTQHFQDWQNRLSASRLGMEVPAELEAIRLKGVESLSKSGEEQATEQLKRTQASPDYLQAVHGYQPKNYEEKLGLLQAAHPERPLPIEQEMARYEQLSNDPNVPEEARKAAKSSFDTLLSVHKKLHSGTESPYKDWKKEHPEGTVEQWLQSSQRPTFPRIEVVNDRQGNIIGYNYLQGEVGGGVKSRFISAGAGGAPLEGGVIPPKPTASILTQGMRSQMIQPQVEALNTQVQQLAPMLGPYEGRLNDVLASRIGTTVKGIPALQMNLKLFATALMQAHGLRGESYEKALEQYLTTAQTSQNLTERINAADTWLQGYAGRVGGGDIQDKVATQEDINEYAKQAGISTMKAKRLFLDQGYKIPKGESK